MNKETRIKKIEEIITRDEKKPFGKMEIPWNGRLETKNVYLIKLEYLVYNKLNGRILSRTKSLETQNHTIDSESQEGKVLIEKLLWDSNETRNNYTLSSINKYGQQKVGIITKDGIIIDGNRRVMLLNECTKRSQKNKDFKSYDYFKTVVLDVTLEENPLEIEKLETTYQMGEDEKVGYNATEKYIKAKLLYKKLTNENYSSKLEKQIKKEEIAKIADWMGEDSSEIIKYLNTMEVMDEYLEYFDYNGIYTQLDKREDQFLNLNKWLKTYYGETSAKGFDGYTDIDVDELKTISFDYIRAKYEGKEFRIIAEGQKANHFFGDKDIWKSFAKFHSDNRESIQEDEIDFNSRDLNRHLNDRDYKFFENTKVNGHESFLKENIDKHEEKLGYNRASEQPQRLVDKASDALEAIKTGHKSFANKDVQSKLKKLGDKVFTLLQKKSPPNILSHIINLLEELDVRKTTDQEKEEIKDQLKKIQTISYKLSKEI